MKERMRDIELAPLRGRTVVIRHATAWDLDTIRNERIGGGVEMPEIDPARIVVAVEDDRIIGFGVVGPTGANETVCVTVFEKKDRQGIGSSIVTHVLERSGLIPEAALREHPAKVVVSKARRSTSRAEWQSSSCTIAAGTAATGSARTRAR